MIFWHNRIDHAVESYLGLYEQKESTQSESTQEFESEIF